MADDKIICCCFYLGSYVRSFYRIENFVPYPTKSPPGDAHLAERKLSLCDPLGRGDCAERNLFCRIGNFVPYTIKKPSGGSHCGDMENVAYATRRRRRILRSRILFHIHVSIVLAFGFPLKKNRKKFSIFGELRGKRGEKRMEKKKAKFMIPPEPAGHGYVSFEKNS